MKTITIGTVLLLLPVLVGCSPGQAKVSGKVLFNGAPLPGGRVTFRPADTRQNSVSADIDREGNYSTVLPVGEVMVSVDNRELEPREGPRGGAPMPPSLAPDVLKNLGGGKPATPPPTHTEQTTPKAKGRYVPIPKKYYEDDTSGLQFTVAGHELAHNIELTK